ncbi:hypothetical protein [Streptomyces buecherae]|uniref:hypothetical protein n=1 Tax=Streptomyces buecherae TaxID=2763006 RepID=UPI001C259B5B|nr:hypothetical protein [Streptomyces buecherae]
MNDLSQQPPSPNWATPPPPPPRKTRKQKALIAAAVTFGALLAIGVIGAIADDGDEDDGKTADRVAAPKTTAPEPSQSPTPEATPTTPEPATEDATPSERPTPEATRENTEEEKEDEKTALLPDFVGRQLQAAQDAAQEAGFYNLTSHDVTGENRFQVYDRNWHICSQTPDPGTHAPDVEVDFGVVKNNETCP